MNHADQSYLARAALSGDARTMRRCATVLHGTADLLSDPSIDGLRRDALLETLRLASEALEDRADWLQEEFAWLDK